MTFSRTRLGLVAQLVERCLCKAEALGPNPSKSTLICTHGGRLDGEGRRPYGAFEAVYKLCDQTLTEFSGALKVCKNASQGMARLKR